MSKLWKKVKQFFKRDNDDLVMELLERRDEVIKRAKVRLPERFRREKQLNAYLAWIIEPHIKKNYTPYRDPNSKSERKAQEAVYNIMEAREQYAMEKEESDKKTE